MAVSTTTANPGTDRQDNWWLGPLSVFLGLSAFAVYATWRALIGFNSGIENHYEFVGEIASGMHAHYISPFASPDLSPLLSPIVEPIMGPLRKLTGWEWLVISPALWILWVPGGFRLTCYYYRKAYYRSFFTSPTACGVDTLKSFKNPLARLLGIGERYRGEQLFPLIIQNLHRYFFYISALFIIILSFDALIAYFYSGHFGIGVGSIVLTLNAVFLAMYTFGCHSWRHLLGGQIDCFSKDGMLGEARLHAWTRQSILNHYHQQFAWISLIWVGFTDFYVWMVASGQWPEKIFWVSNMKLF